MDWVPMLGFRAWIDSRYPRPGSGSAGLNDITGATKALNTMVVDTSLPSDRSAIEPATNICAVALEFIAANPILGVQAVQVIGQDKGELMGGALPNSCVLRPYLRERL
jgi:hypothetical protein